MINNYDKIARYYDRLSRLIFFKSQVNAQIHQLRYLPEKGRVLIVGGGTGWILEEIDKVRPEGLHLVYVEISAKMMELSKQKMADLKKQKTSANTIDFLNIGIEEFSADVTFDVICTPFLFDNFAEERVVMVFHHLDAMLRDGGLWFHTDFNLTGTKTETAGGDPDGKSVGGNGGWWKPVFLTLMYRFFKLAGNVEASKLVSMMPYFTAADYKLLEERYYYRKFIQSLVLEKTPEHKRGCKE
ncbi:class I SAM-dependent methyltransferase [Pedobacter sp. PLR]|uniref:class I SAM-dependent methyltransferase n=1 Tax=Pedobacter sp. PLR TaxID=2994465 RepID=UPI00224689C4|nr:class I SAM-dependent methyltransferase [Pedobacter sp. PLR]MCX2451615.1 class I SAM-dependent methyltransferase [Pedobacter sp. PLR]